jgi:LmbE family N-acetylglucosaminyl deacetylase
VGKHGVLSTVYRTEVVEAFKESVTYRQCGSFALEMEPDLDPPKPPPRSSLRILRAKVSLPLAWRIAILTISLATMSQAVPAPEILQQLRGFREMGSVLYLAAHPDDENTELITYFAKGRNYRTAYLSLTRGDGGQNVLGPEFGAEIGVIRTQELLAARRIDGGRQFFSRAVDFGFSKDFRETLRNWDRQQVLSDIVRVIREFRPDVVVTRFSPLPGSTHGHHTASTVLALEAFKLAGDPTAFPEQRLNPWQPKRILWNESIYQHEDVGENQQVRIEVGGTDPVSGELFTDIAGHSRSMHKTQGFGNFTVSGRGGPRFETFQFLDGAPMTNDIMDGVDTTWNRVSGGAKIEKLPDQIIAQFDPKNPARTSDLERRIRSIAGRRFRRRRKTRATRPHFASMSRSGIADDNFRGRSCTWRKDETASLCRDSFKRSGSMDRGTISRSQTRDRPANRPSSEPIQIIGLNANAPCCHAIKSALLAKGRRHSRYVSCG